MIDNQNTENYNKENELLIYLLTNYNLLIERSFQMTVNPRLPEKNTALTPLRKLGYEAGIANRIYCVQLFLHLLCDLSHECCRLESCNGRNSFVDFRLCRCYHRPDPGLDSLTIRR